uniref:RRM domain-containing protein n=1 Tax=Meloidogyne javanica TaxID=6303 RepID=A0A915N1Q6_MELJA
MVNQLEISASKLQLGHRFDETPTFVLHAIPGSIYQSRECYETIAKQHPQVIYVIHILPSKDSLEYQVLKEHTLAGALVGQGVLAENALAYFKCYELDEVMANMNQWIGRRLAQITARRTKDNYRLTVATGANATNLFLGGEGKNNFDRRSPSFNADNNFEQCVDVVLHSSSFQSYPPNFNKYQIASLFSNFRPLNVQYMEGGETLIQFANKFHAVQVIEQYNGRKYEDEGFILQVRAAAKDDPTQKIGAVKTKLASLLLMVTTSKAVGGENENTSVTSEENKEGW